MKSEDKIHKLLREGKPRKSKAPGSGPGVEYRIWRKRISPLPKEGVLLLQPCTQAAASEAEYLFFSASHYQACTSFQQATIESSPGTDNDIDRIVKAVTAALRKEKSGKENAVSLLDDIFDVE
ncbi:unnamed protein product [Cylicocyclus nassatus]|uniref:Uncharacterized protein n=1 Tax=Cylicocyclus nassatus TaxID=53992 RepID=A0AA36GW04_CYLNA|nr:unnamed protein product [Cylicocyclus nassatus]